jgi:hypothetical protein
VAAAAAAESTAATDAGGIEMKTRRATGLLIAVMLAAALASCGGKKASTPTELFKNFYTAARNKDVAGLKGMMSREALADTERDAKKKGQALDDFLAAQGEYFPPNMPEIRNEKVEGDKASLEFRREGAANWSTAWFVKEDGEWKVNFN